jgi:nodulation protein E
LTLSRPKVLITGMGCVSACGIGVTSLWTAVKSGRSAVGPTQLRRWLNHKVRTSAQIKPDVWQGLFASGLPAKVDPFTQLALAATEEARLQAGFGPTEIGGSRAAVIIGCGAGGLSTQEDAFVIAYGLCETERLDPMTIPRGMMSAAASHVGMKCGVTGPTFVVSSACASAGQAIGVGMLMIRSGVVDRVIAGGTEASLTPATLRAWETLRVLTPDACRPFSVRRNGMVLGEGAGILVLENADRARDRGAKPLAELLGYGTSSDANDILRCDPAGAAAAITLALTDAGLAPEQIDYINAHGTGTVLNDRSESEAVRNAFGDAAEHIAVSSTKPIHGHALGATGALELIATVMAMREGCVPPTMNFIGPDPACALDIVTNEPRSMRVDFALSNSFGFGGINASLIVGAA